MKKVVLSFGLAVAFIYAQTEETTETGTEPGYENSTVTEPSYESSTETETNSENSTDQHLSLYLSFIHSFRKDFYNSFKIRGTCGNHMEELEEADKVLEKCIKELGNDHTLCESVEGYLLNCTSPVVEVLNKCLPSEAKYLPNLGVKAVLSGVNYWCNQRGEAIFELFNPCIWKQFFWTKSKNLRDCFKKFENVTDEYDEEFPSPKRACSDFGDLRNCVKLWVTHDCKNIKTQNSVIGFYDAVLQPCKKYNV